VAMSLTIWTSPACNSDLTRCGLREMPVTWAPSTVIGVAFQPEGAVRYRIKSPTREQVAEESELKLALRRKDAGE
jgi:hypothetical protein